MYHSFPNHRLPHNLMRKKRLSPIKNPSSRSTNSGTGRDGTDSRRSSNQSIHLGLYSSTLTETSLGRWDVSLSYLGDSFPPLSGIKTCRPVRYKKTQNYSGPVYLI